MPTQAPHASPTFSTALPFLVQLDNVILTSSSTAQADAKLAGERRRQQGPTLCTPCIPRPLRVPGVAQQAVPVLRLPRVPVDRGAMLTCAPAPAHCPTARRFRAGSPDAATGRRQSSCQVGGAVGGGVVAGGAAAGGVGAAAHLHACATVRSKPGPGPRLPPMQHSECRQL